jgi:hypothetical protein
MFDGKSSNLWHYESKSSVLADVYGMIGRYDPHPVPCHLLIQLLCYPSLTTLQLCCHITLKGDSYSRN